MPHDPNDTVTELLTRTAELESRYLHLQRLVEDLNDVVIAQGKQLDSLALQLKRTVQQLGTIAQQAVEPRSLEEDKPPHY